MRSRKPELRFTFDSHTLCIEREREREILKNIFDFCVVNFESIFNHPSYIIVN